MEKLHRLYFGFILTLSLVHFGFSTLSLAQTKLTQASKTSQVWNQISNDLTALYQQLDPPPTVSCDALGSLSQEQKSRAVSAGMSSARSLSEFFMAPNSMKSETQPVCAQFASQLEKPEYECCLATSYRAQEAVIAKLVADDEKKTYRKACVQEYEQGQYDAKQDLKGTLCSFQSRDLDKALKQPKILETRRFCYLQGYQKAYFKHTTDPNTSKLAVSGEDQKQIPNHRRVETESKNSPTLNLESSSRVSEAK